MRIQKSLSEVGEQLNKARDELRIVEEQLLFQMDVAEEAKTRALVAETPLADREHQEAQRDLERIRRSRNEVTAKIAELQAEQDRLLDKLIG
jgi:transcription termination factor NusB